jgi:tyrosine-specific transport protein
MIILVFNTLWQFLIIGIIPESLLWKTAELRNAQQGIILFEGSTILTYLYHFLLFFSITTSLLIEGCILVDVFSDGLQIPVDKRTGLKRLLFCLIIFVPSALLSPFDWVLAEDALSGWGELILVGPLPALLVWQVRYTHKLQAPQLLPGGRVILLVFALLSIILFYIQGASLLWSSTI